MYQSDTEILFPLRVTPNLRDLRGEAWREVVDRVMQAPEASLDQLAFSLLLIRLCSCLTCHTHSYRALRGCTLCAVHTIRRFRGEDEELIALYEEARADVNAFMQQGSMLSETLGDSPAGGKE